MNLNFAEALAKVAQAQGQDFAFEMANQARPPQDYLFGTILPEETKPDYAVTAGAMTVRPTMAGLVGMDSPYPETGATDIMTFLANSAKIANQVTLPEQALRELQAWVRAAGLGDAASNEAAANTALNFLDKLIIQAHLDTFEYLRGKALTAGAIDWTFNKKRWQVDYGIPSGNFLPNRTGTAAYAGSASAFWSDVLLLRRILNYDVRAFIAHPDMISDIISNSVNSLRVTNQGPLGVEVVRFRGATEVPSGDQRERLTLIPYAAQGEIYDYVTGGGATTKVTFMPRTKLLAVGSGDTNQFTVGLGATTDPINTMRLGYTHIAPTVEGGGRPGRWSRLYVPDDRPMQLVGQGVTNGMPVIINNTKTAVASSDLSF